jgi:hypothetical protein
VGRRREGEDREEASRNDVRGAEVAEGGQTGEWRTGEEEEGEGEAKEDVTGMDSEAVVLG